MTFNLGPLCVTWTASEVARYLGISRRELDRLWKRGDFIPPLTLTTYGKKRLWTAKSVEAWLNAKVMCLTDSMRTKTEGVLGRDGHVAARETHGVRASSRVDACRCPGCSKP